MRSEPSPQVHLPGYMSRPFPEGCSQHTLPTASSPEQRPVPLTYFLVGHVLTSTLTLTRTCVYSVASWLHTMVTGLAARGRSRARARLRRHAASDSRSSLTCKKGECVSHVAAEPASWEAPRRGRRGRRLPPGMAALRSPSGRSSAPEAREPPCARERGRPEP